MKNKRLHIRRLAGILTAAWLASAAVPGTAQDRQPTPTEKAALERADAALKIKDYVTVRTVLAGAELAQFPRAHSTLYQLYMQGLGGPKDEVAARVR